jgi:hypothetical protein
MSWERCGNTPFYRKEGEQGGGFYTNPFNWTQISVSVEGNGFASVLYRKAPRYDWDILKSAIHAVAGDKEQRSRHLRSTHGWAVDLQRAKELNVKQPELRKMFEEAPKEAREEVLESVTALLNGYDDQALVAMTKSLSESSITLVVVEKGSPAHANLAEIKRDYDFAKGFIVADTLAQGIEEALGTLGIYEC